MSPQAGDEREIVGLLEDDATLSLGGFRPASAAARNEPLEPDAPAVVDGVVMGFLGELFPQQLTTPDTVAQNIAAACPPAAFRKAEFTIGEVLRTAAEWQGGAKPRRTMPGKRSRQPAGRAEFLAAAQRAYARHH